MTSGYLDNMLTSEVDDMQIVPQATQLSQLLCLPETNRICKSQTHIWENGGNFRCLELAGTLSCILQVFGLQAVRQCFVILDYFCTSNTKPCHIQFTEHMHRLCSTAQLMHIVLDQDVTKILSQTPLQVQLLRGSCTCTCTSLPNED